MYGDIFGKALRAMLVIGMVLGFLIYKLLSFLWAHLSVTWR